MSGKKKKSKLSKMLKAQQLQQISLGQVPAFSVSSAVVVPATLPVTAPSPATKPLDRHLNREIFHTLASLAVVALLLVAAVIVNERTSYLTTFGGWLFKALRLAN